jgi:hypothetical protein
LGETRRGACSIIRSHCTSIKASNYGATTRTTANPEAAIRIRIQSPPKYQ